MYHHAVKNAAVNKERKYSVSKREEYEQKTEELLEPIVTDLGFELVDVEYVKEGGHGGRLRGGQQEVLRYFG